MPKQYFISPATIFDEDEEMFFTKIGIKNKNSFVLHCTVWGKTFQESKNKALRFAEIMVKEKGLIT